MTAVNRRNRLSNKSDLGAAGSGRVMRPEDSEFNDLLPYDMVNTDGATGQPETSCRVKLTKLDDWPDFLND